jgi:hypothetical protein
MDSSNLQEHRRGRTGRDVEMALREARRIVLRAVMGRSMAAAREAITPAVVLRVEARVEVRSTVEADHPEETWAVAAALSTAAAELRLAEVQRRPVAVRQAVAAVRTSSKSESDVKFEEEYVAILDDVLFAF